MPHYYGSLNIYFYTSVNLKEFSLNQQCFKYYKIYLDYVSVPIPAFEQKLFRQFVDNCTEKRTFSLQQGFYL